MKLPDGRARMLKGSPAPAVARFGTAESDRPPAQARILKGVGWTELKVLGPFGERRSAD